MYLKLKLKHSTGYLKIKLMFNSFNNVVAVNVRLNMKGQYSSLKEYKNVSYHNPSGGSRLVRGGTRSEKQTHK